MIDNIGMVVVDHVILPSAFFSFLFRKYIVKRTMNNPTATPVRTNRSIFPRIFTILFCVVGDTETEVRQQFPLVRLDVIHGEI